MKPVMMIAGGSIALALVVPRIVPEGTKQPDVNPKNITRQAPSDTTFSNSSRNSKKRIRRSCGNEDGIGPGTCFGGTTTKPRERSRKNRRKVASKVKSGASAPRRSAGGRSVMVQSDARGHFQTTARMNGRRVSVLVDTGATNVAINMSLARKLGISLTNDDFVHKAQTANGIVKIAKTEIRDVRIGGIVLDEVEAFVMPDKALSTTLLGMSFLKRLTKYQVQNGELRLTQ